MVAPSTKEVFIQGVTLDGRTFRPSDWAERLAGVMSQFRPGGARSTPGSHLGYSPWCIPTNGLYQPGDFCMSNPAPATSPHVMNTYGRVPIALERGQGVRLWDFVLNFARDNNLQVAEACLIPDPVKS